MGKQLELKEAFPQSRVGFFLNPPIKATASFESGGGDGGELKVQIQPWYGQRLRESFSAIRKGKAQAL
jgi:hypothetical protein